jgi:hypothetical protein
MGGPRAGLDDLDKKTKAVSKVGLRTTYHLAEYVANGGESIESISYYSISRKVMRHVSSSSSS